MGKKNVWIIYLFSAMELQACNKQKQPTEKILSG